jgi:hypothetical protein
MSPRDYAQRFAAIAVALVATLAIGVTAGHATDAAGPQQGIDTSESQVGSPISAGILIRQGQGAPALAFRKRTIPWRITLQPDTAWLISPYLIERQKHGRWSKMLA